MEPSQPIRIVLYIGSTLWAKHLSQGGCELRLEQGQSAFIPAATGTYRLLAEGRVARAGNR